MRARSLKAWAEDSDESWEVETFQTLESTHFLYRFGVWLYNWIQLHLPWSHHIYFNVLEFLSLHRKGKSIMGRDHFMERVRSFQPQVIVSTHAHLNHGFFELAREALGASEVKCVTYCGELFGDYGFSRHWVNPEADAFIGAVEETCEMAKSLGMPAERNQVGGFMLNPRFYREPEAPEAIREELGLEPDSFVVVLATGANSANNHILLLEHLLLSELRPEVVALCGRSDAAFEEVSTWAQKHPELVVRPVAYFDRMDALLRAASVIVARPGTGTTSEAILCGCPIIFNGIGGIMPQEYITVKYFSKRIVARVIRRPRHLPDQLRPLIEDSTLYQEYCNTLQSMKPEQHPRDILRRLRALGSGKEA